MIVETPMCQTRNGYLHNEGKAESILLSEVVQRYAGDEKVIRCQAPLTKLIQLVQADDQRLEPFLYFTVDRNGSNPCVYQFFSFWPNNLYTEIKSERVIYQVLLMLKSTNAYK